MLIQKDAVPKQPPLAGAGGQHLDAASQADGLTFVRILMGSVAAVAIFTKTPSPPNKSCISWFTTRTNKKGNR